MFIKKKLFLIIIILLTIHLKGFAKEFQDDNVSIKLNRLVNLCKLWGNIKFLHPSLAYRTDIDWDKALIETIPKVKNAKNTIEYRSALQSMINVLDDPLTKISNNTNSNIAVDKNETLDHLLTKDGILIVTIGNYFSLTNSKSQKKLQEVSAKLPNSRAVIFDLRSNEAVGDYGNAIFNTFFAKIERMISFKTLSTPGERRRVYYGYENFSPFASGQYKTGFLTENNSRIIPLNSSRFLPSIFILNENAGVLKSIVSLQKAGSSLVVFNGKDVSVGKTLKLDVGDNLIAQIRTSEPIFQDGTDGSLKPDLIVTENVIENALKLARNFKPSEIKRQKLPVTIHSKRENRYAEMKYPKIEYRILAAFRIWNVIEHFFPYKELMDRDWEEVLREFIPKFEQAKNELEYTLTVAEMMTHIHDSHAYINSSVYNSFIGTGYPPIRVRMIENKLIITAFRNKQISKFADVKIGDEVIKIDGEDAKSRLTKYAKYIAASTPQSKMDKATLAFMNGEPKSIVTLKLRNSNNEEKQVKLTRRYEDYRTLYNRERTGEIIKMLPNNIGYVDLDRLTLDKVDEVFEKCRNTKAIIFDMRGYPSGVAWAIAPRLTDKEPKAALFETPIVGHNLSKKETYARFFQQIQPTPPEKFIYRGETVMLIDERSASQAEHTGLLLRAANRTKFIGSHTAGVNGEVTTFTVPGAITIGFTGQSVKFPNGKQLQRIGIVPDIEIKPTISGIRNKEDEVLNKALRFINSR